MSTQTAPLATPFIDFDTSAEAWRDQAACRSTPDASTLFFSEEIADIAAAKRICMTCTAIVPCLEAAVERHEPCGVWGGQLFERGRILAIKRKRGRPPKHPRAEDQLPAIPVPEKFERLIA